MSGLFGGMKPPEIAPPPPPPAPPAIEDASATARYRSDELRRRQGRAATLMAGKTSPALPKTAAKALTGE